MADINRTTTIELPSEVSSEILAKAIEDSAIMRLARKVTLPGRGLTIPVITGDPTAEWVAETGKKPVSNSGLSTKLMTPYKIAVIETFSNEFRRDAAALYDALVQRLPAALAKTFDQTAIGAIDAPGDNFDTFAAAEVQSILATPYAGLVAADADIADNGGILNGFALSAKGRSILLGAVDDVGRPLFTASATEGAIDRLLGVPVLYNRGLYVEETEDTDAIVGIAGDWSKAIFGTVEGVKIDISDTATLTGGSGDTAYAINLWQQNMFAVRAEIEVGFRADVDCFNLLSGAEATGD